MHPSTKQTLIEFVKTVALSSSLSVALLLLLASIGILLEAYGVI